MKITTKQTAFISVIAIILLALAIGTAAKISQTSLGTQEKTAVTTSNPTKSETTTTEPNTTEVTETIAVTNPTTTEKETSTKVAVIPFETPLGYFKITVYCPSSDGGRWGYQTSTGAKSTHLKTCAVDPNVIPMGSTIKINGLTLKAVDTGNKVKGNVVDIFYDGTRDEAMTWVSEFGTRHEVYIIQQSEGKI